MKNKAPGVYVKELQDTLTEELKPFLGRRSTRRLKDHIRILVEKKLDEHYKNSIIKNSENVDSRILWGTMSVWEKLKWIWYNKINKRIGALKRSEIRVAHEDAIDDWLSESVGRDSEDYPFGLEYPHYLEPDPKNVYIISFKFTPVVSHDYIEIKYNMKEE